MLMKLTAEYVLWTTVKRNDNVPSKDLCRIQRNLSSSSIIYIQAPYLDTYKSASEFCQRLNGHLRMPDNELAIGQIVSSFLKSPWNVECYYRYWFSIEKPMLNESKMIGKNNSDKKTNNLKDETIEDVCSYINLTSKTIQRISCTE
jgi:hypothetical protein